MSEFKGTPGPWYVGDNGMDGPKPRYWIVTNEETWCDRVCSVPAYNDFKAIANANLIAESPKLLEALIDCVALLEFIEEHWIEYDHVYSISVNDAKAAIAKALGKS